MYKVIVLFNVGSVFIAKGCGASLDQLINAACLTAGFSMFAVASALIVKKL